jgi:hypothetical protein
MNSLRLLMAAWIVVLITLALYLARRPELVQRWMLRDADTRLGRQLQVRQQVTSRSYIRRTRAIFIAVATIGILMLLVIIFASPIRT